MGQGKQAQILTEAQIKQTMDYLATTRHALRDRAVFLLSARAGLRACEISRITWKAVMGADRNIADVVSLENKGTKGNKGGRTIPMHPQLRKALVDYRATIGILEPTDHIAASQLADHKSPLSLAVWFHRLYAKLGFLGASSHSGRRTFITTMAQKAPLCGGTIRDVQQLAGHADLKTTMLYIEGNSEAKRAMCGLVA